MQLLGVFRGFRWWHRNKVIILCVHGVADDDDDAAWNPLRRCLPSGTFAKQVALIGEKYSWEPLHVAVEMIEGIRPIRPYTVAITFDDGYVNNKSVALPILAKHNIIPTFYVPTAFINSRKPFWFDRFDYAVQQIKDPYRIELDGEVFEFLPGNRANQDTEYSRLRRHAKEAFDTDRDFNEFFDAHCSRIEEIAGSSLSKIQSTDVWSAIVSEKDIQELSESRGATIGSHTVDHIRLDKVSARECAYQLEKSKSDLEEISKQPCDQFCYPNGNVNAAVAESVKSSGYRSAVTSVAGFNPVGSDRYQLKRIHLPRHSNATKLAAQLCGFEFAVDRLRAGLRRTFAISPAQRPLRKH